MSPKWISFLKPEYTHVAHKKRYSPCREELGQNCEIKSALDNRARPADVLDSTLALQLVRIIADINKDGKTAFPEILLQCNAFTFSATVPAILRPKHNPKKSAVLISELLPFDEMNRKLCSQRNRLHSASYLWGYSQNHVHCYQFPRYRTRCKLRALITHPNRSETSHYAPRLSETACRYKITSTARLINTFASPYMRLVEQSLVHYCSKPCCEHPPRYGIYRSVYLRNFPDRKKILPWNSQPFAIVVRNPRKTEFNVVD